MHDTDAVVLTPQAAMLRIAIVEDHRELRECLTALLDGTEGFRCTGSFRSMEDALAAVRSDTPDLMLVDLGLPGMGGIEGIRVLKARYPQLLVLALTVHADDERVFGALCAGACGYLLKRTPPARLIEALKEAATGGAPMSPEIARKVIEHFRRVRPPDGADYHLTPHELRVLTLLSQGHNYRTAAAELSVTPSTISFHLQRVYEKLQVHSKTEAVAKALRQRLI